VRTSVSAVVMPASLDRSGRGRARGFAGKRQAIWTIRCATPGPTGGGMDMRGIPGGGYRGRTEGACMRYKVGAEQMEQVPSLAHRPEGSAGRPGPLRSAPPMRWTPPPARSHAGSRVTGWTCWTRTGKRRSLSRSAPAVSPPSSPTVRRDQQLSGRAASVARSPDAASRGCRAGRAQAAPHPPAGAATTAPGHAHPAHQCQHRLRAGLAGPDRYQASTDAWITSLTWTTTWTGCPPDP
jgi:hypothetical protein